MSQHMAYMVYVLWTLKIMSSINVDLILLVDDVVEFYILALIFCLIALSIIEREVLTSPAIIVVSFISFFSFIYFIAPLFSAYIFRIAISSWRVDFFIIV